MSVQLTVIGCSPAWPNPGGAHSGYLVEGPEGGLLLDCGPGVLARLRQTGLHRVDAIAITHFHLDHWGDLVPWAWLAAHGGVAGPKPALWLPPAGREDLAIFAARWGRPDMFDHAFEVEEFEPAAPFAAAGFEVQALAVEHYGIEAFGLRVRDPDGGVLAYSGDSGPCEALRLLAAGADLFLCEATLATGAADASPRGHLSLDEAAALADGRQLITHRPAELDTPSELERASEGLVAAIEPGRE